MKPGLPTPVRLTAYVDRTFTFEVRTPPNSWFLKRCANIEKGAGKPGLESVGKVTLKQIFEIAKIKQTELDLPLQGICRSIAGSARAMGIEVISGKEVESKKTENKSQA